MKKDILSILEQEFKLSNSNIVQKNFIKKLYEKIETDEVDESSACSIVDIISNHLAFDSAGNPIKNTLDIEAMIDWVLEKYN